METISILILTVFLIIAIIFLIGAFYFCFSSIYDDIKKPRFETEKLKKKLEIEKEIKENYSHMIDSLTCKNCKLEEELKLYKAKEL